jgi:hypothetical protein
MSANTPAERPIIHHRGVAWDTRLCITLFVACVGGPAVMTRPSMWAWIVFGLHIVGMILFYYLAKHAGRRQEREAREEAFTLNRPLPNAETWKPTGLFG